MTSPAPVHPVADPIATLVAHVGTLTEITDQLSGERDIYGDALPPKAGMPRKAIVFRHAGGLMSDSLIVVRPRIELRTYGATDKQAGDLWWSVYGMLHLQGNIVAAGGRILSIVFDGGPAGLMDQTLNTPFKLGFFNMFMQLRKCT
jgi:hypothetical protein